MGGCYSSRRRKTKLRTSDCDRLSHVYDEPLFINDPSGSCTQSLTASVGKDLQSIDDVNDCLDDVYGYSPPNELQRNNHGRRSGLSNDSAFCDISGGSLKSSSSDTTAVKRPTIHGHATCTMTTMIEMDESPPVIVNYMDPSEHIPQMIEIFRKQLESSIKVQEVISYLPFIEDREDILALESPRDAVHRLLNRIVESNEAGKWRTFLNALNTVGYQYISNLLTGKTEVDFTMQKKMVKIFEPELIYRMDTVKFRDHLYQEDAISVMDKEELECEEMNRGQIASNLMMIDKLQRKSDNWYHTFVNAMKTCGMDDVAENFECWEIPPEDSEAVGQASSKLGALKEPCTTCMNESVGARDGTYIQSSTDEHTTDTSSQYLEYEENCPSVIEPPPVPPRIPVMQHDPQSVILTIEAELALLSKKVQEQKEKKRLLQKILALQKEHGKLKADNHTLRRETEIQDVKATRTSDAPGVTACLEDDSASRTDDHTHIKPLDNVIGGIAYCIRYISNGMEFVI